MGIDLSLNSFATKRQSWATRGSERSKNLQSARTVKSAPAEGFLSAKIAEAEPDPGMTLVASGEAVLVTVRQRWEEGLGFRLHCFESVMMKKRRCGFAQTHLVQSGTAGLDQSSWAGHFLQGSLSRPRLHRPLHVERMGFPGWAGCA